jgi:hypothetical protein
MAVRCSPVPEIELDGDFPEFYSEHSVQADYALSFAI